MSPQSRHLSLLSLLLLLAPASPSPAASPARPPVPRLDGPWIQLVGRPPLERWASPDAEPVDFTVFRADDGSWQLISCIRKTTQPGKGRLLYRWSSPDLLREGWTPAGIFLESDPALGHAEGLLQAPNHVLDAGLHYLFFNSRGAHLLTSPDGLHFQPHGAAALFPMGRDVHLFDDRPASGRWIAYYTSFEAGLNPATKDHTIRARTAPALTGPWSAEAIEVPPRTPPPTENYLFVYAESPLVIRRGDTCYRFEQMFVYASPDPLVWPTEPLTCLLPKDPIRYLAPEIVSHAGRDYLLAYQWRNQDPRGIFLAPLAWD